MPGEDRGLPSSEEQALIDRADEVAGERAMDRLAAIGTIGPNTAITNDRVPHTPLQVAETLAAAGVFVPLQYLANRTWEERAAAEGWAATVVFNAEASIEEEIPDRPEWLPARDSDTARHNFNTDLGVNGGWDAVVAKFHEPFLEAGTKLSLRDELRAMGEDNTLEHMERAGLEIADEPKGMTQQGIVILISKLLASAAWAGREIQELSAIEAKEIEIIQDAYAAERGPLERRAERATELAEQLAQFVDYGPKKKTLNLPYGSVGFQEKSKGAEIVDVDDALAWAIAKRPEAVRLKLDIRQDMRDELNKHLPENLQLGGANTEQLDKTALKRYAIESGEEIPGVRNLPERTEWFARPKLPASVTEREQR